VHKQPGPTSAKYREDVHHYVFTSKYRHPVLVGQVRPWLDRAIRAQVETLGGEVMALAIRPDHVHLLVAMPRTVHTARLAQRVKWHTSYHARRVFPHLQADRALWGRDFWVRSVGGGRPAVRKYIEDQKIGD